MLGTAEGINKYMVLFSKGSLPGRGSGGRRRSFYHEGAWAKCYNRATNGDGSLGK